MKQRIKTWEVEKKNIIKLLSIELGVEVTDIDSYKIVFRIDDEVFLIYKFNEEAPRSTSCSKVNSEEDAILAFNKKLETDRELERLFKIIMDLLW